MLGITAKLNNTLILHDYFASLEGGGRLCSILANGLGFDLGYGFARPQHPFLTTVPTQHDLKAYSRLPLWQQFKLAHTFAHHATFVKDYTTVIYSGFYTPLASRQHSPGRNVLYCHTPPRFLYDQREFYLEQLPIALRPLLHAFIRYLQPRYEQAVKHMDIVIANSENVRSRIQRYLNRDALVIQPPCDTTRFTWQGQGNYYLSTARLDPLKRVEMIVRAFLEMPDKRLIVTSGGTELARLRRLAQHAPHIELTDWTDEATLATLMGNAIATLYLPKAEDFGMSPLESMAAGKPVIGVAEGGLIETILPETTGILLKPIFTTADICTAVHALTPERALTMRSACEQRAYGFRTEIFLQKMHTLLSGFTLARE